jgi:hypothetical protein
MPANTVTLRRTPSTDQGTFGRLSFGTHTVHTIELPWRDNRRQRSCIPPGTYRCALVNSPKFGRVYQVHAVPGRDHVLIHAANLAGDVDLGFTTQLHGCLSPALRLGTMRNTAGQMQAAALVSKPALNQFTAWSAGNPFTLEITQ